jgi:hypothetical protein
MSRCYCCPVTGVQDKILGMFVKAALPQITSESPRSSTIKVMSHYNR